MTGNKNYRRGRNKEYRIMEKLRKEGCDIVLRSAGSHSLIDVIGIRKSDKKIFLVQSKPKKISENFKTKLLEEISWLNDEFIGRVSVI